MTIDQTDPGARLTLAEEELELLRLALRRATFVDIPPDRQREVVAFAEELLRRLGG